VSKANPRGEQKAVQKRAPPQQYNNYQRGPPQPQYGYIYSLCFKCDVFVLMMIIKMCNDIYNMYIVVMRGMEEGGTHKEDMSSSSSEVAINNIIKLKCTFEAGYSIYQNKAHTVKRTT